MERLCESCLAELPEKNDGNLCSDCAQSDPYYEMNHESTSDVVGFSSDWFEVTDVFDEFPGT